MYMVKYTYIYCLEGSLMDIGGTVNAAIRFLGLAVRATAARRACVNETMRHKKGAVTHRIFPQTVFLAEDYGIN